MTEEHSRKDDKFLRSVIWLLLTVSLSSAGGWIYTIAYSQAELSEAIHRIDKLEKIQVEISKSMSSIDKGVGVLIALAEVRNEQQKDSMEKQNYIFGEQKRRASIIAWVEKQMALK